MEVSEFQSLRGPNPYGAGPSREICNFSIVDGWMDAEADPLLPLWCERLLVVHRSGEQSRSSRVNRVFVKAPLVEHCSPKEGGPENMTPTPGLCVAWSASILTVVLQ